MGKAEWMEAMHSRHLERPQENLHMHEPTPCASYHPSATNLDGPDRHPYCWWCGWSRRSHADVTRREQT